MSQKKPVLSVNLSHPFPLKNRCKHCGSNKLSYFHDYSNPYWYPDTRYARNRCTPEMIKGWAYGTHSDKELSPLFQSMSIRADATHSIGFKRYNPKLAKSWADGNGRGYISQMLVVVVCDSCDLQTWAYINGYNRKMPENFHRKARINCPQKIPPLDWRNMF
jgi:hypothetical protein